MIKKINWLFLVTGTLIMLYVMASTGRPLQTTATPLGILNLEFAYSSEKVNTVIDAWSPGRSDGRDNIKIAIKNTWLDFIFLFFYSLLLFYACMIISAAFSGFFQKLGLIMAMGALNAGLLDIAENAGMLISLNGFTSNSISMFTAICAAIKWLFALSALAYIMFTGPFFIYKQLKKK